MWRKRVQAFEARGLSRCDWCLRHRVALSSMGDWRRRLREAASARAGARVPIVVD
ncbi:MAG: IS66 family insertion sequence element accessory protein TnpA [Pseudomonadota bacterium]